jgi:hypothetical protein
MAKLYGAQRLVLQTILDAQGDSQSFVEDYRVAQSTRISLRDMRDWLHTLDHDDYVDLVWTENGFKVSVTAKGRLALGLYRPFPAQPSPVADPSKARTKTGRERALVIGVSNYPLPISKLPAVANDVREIGNLLRSEKSEFLAGNVISLVDHEADQQSVINALEAVFREAQSDDPVFVYMAGHGTVLKDEYFFVAHDTKVADVATTGVPLKKIKDAFDASPSQRAVLWLDFCHSGGILARDLAGAPDDKAVIERTIKVVQGQGKAIMAACTAYQKAWESPEVGHGLFTNALLKGLKGEAKQGGEVTINSLFDYIDRQVGSDRQRPMMFGQMTGRVVLMHYA